jgi:hypothetical protein
MMILYGHAPIVPYYIDTIFFNSTWGKIPVTWITDIRFLYLFAVNKKFSVKKFNLFPLQSNHAF